jgi:TusA-related sulfurtransferase
MNTKRRDWVINKDDLLQFINEQKLDEAHKYEKILADLDDKILVEDIKGFIGKNAIKYTKQEKDDELLLKIQLLR